MEILCCYKGCLLPLNRTVIPQVLGRGRYLKITCLKLNTLRVMLIWRYGRFSPKPETDRYNLWLSLKVLVLLGTPVTCIY
jgi:hypothetical protein